MLLVVANRAIRTWVGSEIGKLLAYWTLFFLELKQIGFFRKTQAYMRANHPVMPDGNLASQTW